MAETVEELSYDYEEEGKLVRRELRKDVLTKGSWATVMFLFQELDRKTEQWGEPKVSIVRFKKASGSYRKQSSFNISSEKQARQIVGVIERWYGDVATGTIATSGEAVEAQRAAQPRPSPEAAPAKPKKKAPPRKAAAAAATEAGSDDGPEPPEEDLTDE